MLGFGALRDLTDQAIAVFGEPLSPRQVVQRICDEVREEGLEAVLRFGRLLDGAELDAGTLPVSEEELVAAHQAADPQFLETIRRIRDNILEFQQAILCNYCSQVLHLNLRKRKFRFLILYFYF